MPTTTDDKKEETPDIESQLAEMRASMAKVEAENKKLRDNQRENDSTKFADEVIAAFKAWPSEKLTLISLFRQALIDDSEDDKPSGLAHFGETKAQATRVGALKAMFAIRPSYEDLTKEGIEAQVEDGILLFGKKPPQNEEEIATIDPKRRAKLLGHTTLGTQVLSEKAE